jgi:replicative DNA helicase
VTESVDPERLALSWCIRHTDLLSLIDSGLTPEDFDDKEHRLIYEWARAFYQEHGTSPGEDALRLHNPNWRLATPTDGIAVYVKDIRTRQRYNLAVDIAQELKDALAGDDVDRAAEILLAGATDMAVKQTQSLDVDLTVGWKERADYYGMLRANPGRLRGLPTGFQTIDRATNGIQPAQLVTFAGVPGSGKSTVLLSVGKHLNERGKVGLGVSFEMSQEEQAARWDAMWAHVSHKKIMEGRTTREEHKKIERAMQRAEDGYPFYLSTDVSRVTTVSGIAAKVEKFKPDFVLVDGVYLMMDDYGEPPGSWSALSNITRDFKRLAQQTLIPFIITTQVSTSKVTKRGVRADSLAFSQSFLQDSDVLIGLQPADDENDEPMQMRVLKSRHGPLVQSDLEWDWDRMVFTELYGGSYESPDNSGAGGF